MCRNFSFITDPVNHPGKRFYFDTKYRKEEIKKYMNRPRYSSGPEHFDAHSSICQYFNLNEDTCNKYEYIDPKFLSTLTTTWLPVNDRILYIDMINSRINDSNQVARWLEKYSKSLPTQPVSYLLGLEIGTVLTFFSEDIIFQKDKNGLIYSGWCSEGMSQFCNDHTQVKLTQERISNIDENPKSAFMYINDWSIDLSMLRKLRKNEPVSEDCR